MKKVQTYEDKFKHNRQVLIFEVVFTVLITLAVIYLGISNIASQAREDTQKVENDYQMLLTEYTRLFDTMFLQIEEKIQQDLTFEEMDAWLKSKEDSFANAMGKDYYDGIAITYKGGYAHSWSYGDYTDYDATSRRWYQVAEEANGKTAIVAPYVTFLDAQYNNDDSYILMSIVKKYNDEIYADYDLKLVEVKEILRNWIPIYENSNLSMFDKNGYVLSSNREEQFAHNLFVPDKVISESRSQALKEVLEHPETLQLKWVDGQPQLVYLAQNEYENTVCLSVPFLSVVKKDFLAILLLALFLILIELWMYRQNKSSLMGFKSRDDRLTAVSRATFQDQIYIDHATMKFYGNERASAVCPNGTYAEFYEILRGWLDCKDDEPALEAFVSPEVLEHQVEELNKMTSKRFAMNQPDAPIENRTHVMELNRLDYLVDGRMTTAILVRDVSEDAGILKDALKQAEKANRAKSAFMSRVSHEIRTPLNAVIGYMQIAKDSVDNPDKMMHCVENSEAAARHLLSIINDVLDVSAIESGKMKIAHEVFDLKKQITSLSTMFFNQAKGKGVSFDTVLSNVTEEMIVGDSLRLNQILMNLLSNAVKFTPKGGLITLGITQNNIDEKLVHLKFTVSDTGIGMSEEYQQRLFQPFEQESASTAQKYGGSGLGLSITYNLVKMMDGSIDVHSKQGEGSTFVVSLSFERSGEVRKELSMQDFKNIRVLIVDDDEAVCEYMKALFKRCKIKCDVVTSGEAAIRQIIRRKSSDYNYDICIIDWNMPDMDGIETARRIKQECDSDIPIVIATAYDITEFEEEAKAIGVSRIISKPLFQSTMFDLLVSTFGRYEVEEEPEMQFEEIKGLRVLLAEDNPMNLEIAIDILGKAGLVVDSVTDGKQAVDRFTSQPAGSYDAILMDIQMPVMNGYEATAAIRSSSHPEAGSIPIIAMTANAFTEDVNAALASGMNGHIAKPVEYAKLYKALSECRRSAKEK